jgi:hypothetical protein
LILGKGETCLVDEEDYKKLSKFTWNKSQYGYAYRLGDRSKGEKWKILMHREIMGADDGSVIDHMSGDKLDNRMCNLRFVTRGQNVINSRGRNAASGYKGVTLNKSSKSPSWKAILKINHQTIQLGCYKTKEEAAKAYNEAAVIYHREFAKLNEIVNGDESMNKDDLLFRALANMGNASNLMAWANTCIEEVTDVPEEIKAEMIGINATIHRLQEHLREVRKNISDLH